MIITKLKSKIAYIKVTKTDVYYDGSLGIAEDIMEQAQIEEYEQVHVLNVTNKHRFITYAIKEPKGTENICVYGAAAHLAEEGDEVIILTYGQVETDKKHEPLVINYCKKNKSKKEIL